MLDVSTIDTLKRLMRESMEKDFIFQDTISKDLETVWRRCAKLAVPNAVLAIRFKAINDRAVTSETIIRKSLDKTPWTISDIHGSGMSPHKIFPSASTVLNDVRHQAEVPLDKHIPGLRVPLGITGQPLPLLRGGQGLWKRSAAGQAKGEQQRIGKQ